MPTFGTEIVDDTGAPRYMPRKTPLRVYTASTTAIAADAEGLVRINVASANTYTIPANASVPFAVGTRIDVQQVGAGQTTIGAASGVTIEVTNRKISAQYAAVSLVKVDTDTWTIIGPVVA